MSKMLKFTNKLKPTSQSEQELLYHRLELILKQMLLVLAKENVALNKVSGKKNGNDLFCTNFMKNMKNRNNKDEPNNILNIIFTKQL